MARHRTHSVEFTRQVAREFLAGETLYGLARRHDICRNLIRVWVKKFEAAEFDEDAVAIDLVQQHEARIAALERLVGKQALEIEFPKGAHKLADRRRSAPGAAVDDTAIVEAMAAICDEFEAYGRRRVGAALRQRGLVVNHRKVRRLMREHDLQPRRRRAMSRPPTAIMISRSFAIWPKT